MKSVILIISVATTLVVFGACSVKEHTAESKTIAQPKSAIKSMTSYENSHAIGYLVTVEHDGHLFIAEGRYGKGAILHHPDCLCLPRK